MKKLILPGALPVFKADPLTVSVVSDVVMAAPNRLLATLKVERSGIGFSPIRHSFNLYNHREVSNMSFRMAFQLKVNVGNILMGIAHFTGLIEACVKEQQKQDESAAPQPAAMYADESEAVIAFLRRPALMDDTLSQLKATGIQGEDFNCLILYLAMTSRKQPRPLSVAVVGKSGSGKSWLVDRIANCMPEPDVEQPVSYTGGSFYRQSPAGISNKVFVIDDFDTAHRSLQPLLDLHAKGRTAKTVTVKDATGRPAAKTHTLTAPICLVTCTGNDSAAIVSSTNTIPLFLDGGTEKGERIMEYQRQLSAGLADPAKEAAAAQQLRHVQKVLHPVRVINPYAHLVTLPPSVLSPRRVLPLLLSFIEAITFYYQYQREYKKMPGTGEEYIESTSQDMYWAYKLLAEVLLIKSDELGGCTGSFYGWLKDWTSKDRKMKFGAADIRKVNPVHPRRLQRYLAELADYGKITFSGGSRHTGYRYVMAAGQQTVDHQAAIGRHMGDTMLQIEFAHDERIKAMAQQEKESDKKTETPCTNQSHVALKPAPIASYTPVAQIPFNNKQYVQFLLSG